MRPLVTPEEMAAAEKAAIDSGTPVEELMDRAGRAVARTAIRMMEGRYGKKVAVVCGKGNNAGDGYAAARILRREGVAVRCIAIAPPSELAGAARYHYDLAQKAGVSVTPFDGNELDSDLVIDAIYGTGLTPRPDGVPEEYFKAIQLLGHDRGAALILSIDVPSGISGEFGPIMSPVHADVTVTFGAEKVGTFLAPPEYTGQVEIADIGIKCEGEIDVLERANVADLMPHRPIDSHKRSSGSVLVIAGSDAMPGAAALVVRGAMRAGCGYVTVACTEKVGRIVNELCPEALVQVVTSKDHLDPSILERLSSVIERSTIVVVGPGLGTGDDQSALVRAVIGEVDLPLILDADGLNALPGGIEHLQGRKRVTAITPHPAELARLMDANPNEVDDRLGAARAAARRSGCEVLLKGFRTVIVGPDSRTYVNPTGGPELATAGTGDVLTGVVATFLGSSPDENYTESVAAAAYIHGLAGSLAAETGDQGIVAWDVAEALPRTMDLVRSDAS
ncbi:MAG: ADP-dependent NAD(P)H-hydrate dehydratase / NAD(P)H-hydrate epimerase [Actinomycetota bacterium]|nr:ADP-dependent NAD(P)H-hydrate dehydratase / NAD(P)H-hydrate epimerase [Actinomycetota bacterium]